MMFDFENMTIKQLVMIAVNSPNSVEFGKACISEFAAKLDAGIKTEIERRLEEVKALKADCKMLKITFKE